MRGTTVKKIRSTSLRLLGRPLRPTSWCEPASYRTTLRFWRWGKCQNPDTRHKSHRYRYGSWNPFVWGTGPRGHLKSEVRQMKRLYRLRKAA